MKLTENIIKFILEIGKQNSMRKKATTSKISRNINVTRSYCTLLTKQLEINNFIYRKKDGRDKYVYLTTDGWKAFHCLRILRELDLK